MTLTIYRDLDQGSEEWLAARCGIVTASVVGRLLTSTGKVASNDTSRALTATLVAERITGRVEPVFPSRAMTRGTLLEDEARRLFSELTGNAVDQIGFARLDTDTYTVGASPDGLIGPDGGLEIKCPTPKTHIQTVLTGGIPTYNRAQVQASMFVTGRAWWDFCSYLPGEALFITRDRPEPRWQEAIQEAVEIFEKIARSQVDQYRMKMNGKPKSAFWDPFDEAQVII